MDEPGHQCHRCGAPANHQIAAWHYCDLHATRLLESCWHNARRRILTQPTVARLQHGINIGVITREEAVEAARKAVENL